MTRRTIVSAQSLLVMALFASPSFAADDEALKKDLTAVIALQGLPCGEVVAVTTLAENNYAASCKDSNKYHVFLNDGGLRDIAPTLLTLLGLPVPDRMTGRSLLEPRAG